MVKRLALVLAALSWISPLSVYALGLGSIDMQSGLNQRLDARIKLMRVRSGELDGMEVSLASAATFRRAGIERPNFLARIKFSLVRPSSGKKPYIHLTSSKPITEPFLNFLIEVNWSNGRLLREFTVLVDPPVLSADIKQKSIEAPVTRQAPPVRRAPPRTARAVPPRRRSVPPRTRRPAPEVQVSAEGGVEYGPVKRGDTLWEIAAQIRTDRSVSIPQMMIALLESNPNAFIDHNINNLKMGHVLRLGDTDSAASVSSSEAARMASLQWEEWKEAKGLTVGSTPSRTRASSKPVQRDARVRLVSPGDGEDGIGTPRTVADGSQVARLNEELSLSQEALDTTKQETSELTSRLDALKGQMDTMKRLINLKDNQLVALQSQLKEAGESADLKDSAESLALSEELAATKAASKEQLSAEIGDISIDEQSEMEAILAGEDSGSQLIDEDQLANDETQSDPLAIDSSADNVATDGGIVATIMALPGKIMGDLKLVGGIVAVLLVLGGFAWLVIRRRSLQQFQESILTGQSSVGDVDMTESPSEDASFMSDFAVSSMEGIQTDVSEVDPISEADVYLAYGRYKQAEELISSAIEGDPDRADLKMKALEIQYAAKDKDAFELQVDMYKDGLLQTEHWARVAEMGQELAPENALFSADGVSEVVGDGDTLDAVDNSIDDLGDLDFGDSEFASSEFADLSADDNTSAAQAVDDLDFNLGDDTADAAATQVADIVETPDAAPDDNSLDFDLGDFDTGDSSGSSSSGTEQMDVISEMSTDDSTTEAVEDNSFDFDLGSLGTDDAPASASEEDVITADSTDDIITADTPADDNSLDFDLSIDDTAAAVTESESADEEEFSMEITDADMDAELDDSLFADVDEVGTKLDLAKAYIDMGDSDGAKSILDEVLEEGDDSQKNEAEGLMAQMA